MMKVMTEKKPYIELFHETVWALEGGRNSGPEGRRLYNAIQWKLDQGYEIYFNPNGDFNDSPIVEISKDTQIIIGGNEWGICVQERARVLRKMGYKNVTTDHALSYDTFR